MLPDASVESEIWRNPPPLPWQSQTLALATRRTLPSGSRSGVASASAFVSRLTRWWARILPCACSHDFFSLLRLLLAPHPLVDASLAASLRTLFFGGSCFSAHVVSLPPPTHDFLSPSLRHLLPSLPDARVESEFWKSFRLHFTPHPLVGVSLAARCAVRRLRVVPRVRPLTRSSSFLLPVLTLHWVRMRRRCVPHGALPRFHFRRFSRIAPAVVRCVRFAAHVVLGGSCFSAHVVSLPSPHPPNLYPRFGGDPSCCAISFAPTSWSF